MTIQTIPLPAASTADMPHTLHSPSATVPPSTPAWPAPASLVPIARARSPRVYPRVSVIIAARNDALNLPYILPSLPELVGEVILVDGHSIDDTIGEAARLRPDVHIVFQQGRGRGDALRAGLTASTGDIVVVMDADGSSDPAEIPALVAALLGGADLAIGSRFAGPEDHTTGAVLGRWGHRQLTALVNRLFSSTFSEACAGCIAFWRDCLHCFAVEGAGGEVATRITLRALKAGLAIAEVPSCRSAHIHGPARRQYSPYLRDGGRALRTLYTMLVEWANGSTVVGQADYAPDRRARRDDPPTLSFSVRAALRTYAQAADQILVRRRAPHTAAGPNAGDPAVPMLAADETSSASVIVTCGDSRRWSQLEAAIAALRRQTVAPYEIIVVVDHNSALYARAQAHLRAVTGSAGEGARDVVAAIENDGEPGILGARNAGIARATGDVVAFLDDESVPAPDWLERLVNGFRWPEVLGVGGAIEADWLAGTAKSPLPPDWLPAELSWIAGCAPPGADGRPRYRTPVARLSGGNFAFRRSVLAAMGGFATDDDGRGSSLFWLADAEYADVERAQAECAETELCLRICRRWPQHTLLFEPAARVTRPVPASQTTWRHVRLRCALRGRVRARIARLDGARKGLASERQYARWIWFQGLLATLREAVARRDRAALARVGALLGSQALASGGFLAGSVAVRLDGSAEAQYRSDQPNAAGAGRGAWRLKIAAKWPAGREARRRGLGPLLSFAALCKWCCAEARSHGLRARSVWTAMWTAVRRWGTDARVRLGLPAPVAGRARAITSSAQTLCSGDAARRLIPSPVETLSQGAGAWRLKRAARGPAAAKSTGAGWDQRSYDDKVLRGDGIKRAGRAAEGEWRESRGRSAAGPQQTQAPERIPEPVSVAAAPRPGASAYRLCDLEDDRAIPHPVRPARGWVDSLA